MNEIKNHPNFVEAANDFKANRNRNNMSSAKGGSKLKTWFCGVGDILVENVSACVSQNDVYKTSTLINDNGVPLREVNSSLSGRISPRTSTKYSINGERLFHSNTTRTVSATTSSGCEDEMSDKISDEIRETARFNAHSSIASNRDKSKGKLQVVNTEMMERDGMHNELIGTHCNYRLDPIFIMDVINHLDTTISPWYKSSDGKAKPTCVYSEPCASKFKVRGSSYCYDQMKVQSIPSTMALIGADKFVKSGTHIASNSYYHVSLREKSFLNRFRSRCVSQNIEPPFVLIFNFILPWGNFLMYTQRPDGDGGGPFKLSENDVAYEQAWRKFVRGSQDFRDRRLKLISSVNAGPFIVKKMVGSNKPAIIGQKVAVSVFGSAEENYLEICLDICKGSKLAHSITNAVCGHANQVTVDLAFTVEGNAAEGTLPERILTGIRLHHMALKGKSSITMEKFEEELSCQNAEI